MRWIQTLALCGLCALGCKQEDSKPAARTADTDTDEGEPDRDAAAGAPSADATGPGVPALGRTDAEAARAIVDRYKTLRPVLRAGEDFEPSASQRKSLQAIAGDRFAALEKAALEADWGQAAAQAWLLSLAEQSRDGLESIVRMPLSQCVGYGSATPSDYAATGCFSPAVLFVEPVGETDLMDACAACSKKSGVKLGQCREKRCSMVVEGYFTGETHEAKDAPPGQKGPVAHEFHVQKARIGKADAPTLRLPGGHGPAGGPVIANGPRWGVMWANAFAIGKAPEAVARKVADKLRASGFADIELLDSRRIPGLWCCSQAILIDRFDSRARAKARAREIKKKTGIDALIVREIY